MWLAAERFPSLTFPFPGRSLFAIAVAGIGIAIALSGVAAFRSVRTTVDPTAPESSSTLVTRGIYRLTRNPMYLGFLLILVALGVQLSNVVAVALTPLFILYLDTFQIGPEERVLTQRFGDVYRQYLRATRRWL
ncbi:isoprenylcysteine carboxylmethyltransferase family protein [Lysobacter sp. LF1]|uniref:Isoprenylcysteine carboxylmethyltransferase family protein n=1 Tax=Lysobacter stagni TaxID=3045172 RepID=A0ABT6XHV1_9GAMM|nr:isoprenylcysteine carboxylmethyltransferase family protein [Lysobacter sp. LF1]MDI9239360.1 isoprenylcysteine carboxylmethyltransferase family protein [Lysobacter sp. LF1]